MHFDENRSWALAANKAGGGGSGSASRFARLLRRDHSRILVTPCGILAPLIDEIGRNHQHIVSREDVAIGLATGFALAGARTAVLMQNSGLGQSINALASLACPYKVPMSLVISLRGTDNDSTEENAAMGRVSKPLLRELGIPITTVSAGADSLDRAYREMAAASSVGPAAILISPSVFGWVP